MDISYDDLIRTTEERHKVQLRRFSTNSSTMAIFTKGSTKDGIASLVKRISRNHSLTMATVQTVIVQWKK